MDSKNFQKPPLSIEEQLDLLRSRGLVIRDEKTAKQHLTFISYYRFCGYGIEFEDDYTGNQKSYQDGTTFEQVLDCYVFDRKLRLLVIDSIERIEIAVRTVITNELAWKYGAHWYLDSKLFLKSFRHSDLLQTIKKETLYKAQDGSVQHQKRERFIQHYFDKYSDPELPAVWMVAEVLSLGAWSMIFSNLIDRENQKVICRSFGIDRTVMTSWLHSLTYLRNLCAHHSKLWSRHFTLKPVVANRYRKQLENNARFSAQAAIIKIFLGVISPDGHWARRLYQLTEEHPKVDIERMGFKKGWQSDPFWGIT